MSPSANNHQRALRAIAQGDTAQLKQLLSPPVRDTRRSLDRLAQLVTEAAQRGQRDAVFYLLACEPKHPTRRDSVAPDAWVGAIEAGQRDLSGQLWSSVPTIWSTQAAQRRYQKVVNLGAWRAVAFLLEEGYRPTDEELHHTLDRMGREHTPERMDRARSLLRTLAAKTPAEALGWVAEAALALQHEDIFRACLAGATRPAPAFQDVQLRRAAARANRYDLVGVINRHYDQIPNLSQSIRLLDLAVEGGHFDFAEQLLSDRPDVVQGLAALDRQPDAIALGTALLQRGAEEGEEPRLQPLFLSVCASTHWETMRERWSDVPGAMHSTWLNRMARWVTPEVREQWLSTYPLTFAEVIAQERAQQAHEDPHENPTQNMKGRPRARP